MLHRICFYLLGTGLLLLAACAPSETPSEAIKQSLIAFDQADIGRARFTVEGGVNLRIGHREEVEAKAWPAGRRNREWRARGSTRH